MQEILLVHGMLFFPNFLESSCMHTEKELHTKTSRKQKHYGYNCTKMMMGVVVACKKYKKRKTTL